MSTQPNTGKRQWYFHLFLAAVLVLFAGSNVFPAPPLKIVNTELDGLTIIISGNSFGTTTPPVVTLGVQPLSVGPYTNNEIVASLPPLILPGTYLLVVTNTTTGETDDFDVAIGDLNPGSPPGNQLEIKGAEAYGLDTAAPTLLISGVNFGSDTDPFQGTVKLFSPDGYVGVGGRG